MSSFKNKAEVKKKVQSILAGNNAVIMRRSRYKKALKAFRIALKEIQGCTADDIQTDHLLTMYENMISLDMPHAQAVESAIWLWVEDTYINNTAIKAAIVKALKQTK